MFYRPANRHHQFNLYTTKFSIKANFLIQNYKACSNKDKLVIENLVCIGPKLFRVEVFLGQSRHWCKVLLGPKCSSGQNVFQRTQNISEVNYYCHPNFKGLQTELGFSMYNNNGVNKNDYRISSYSFRGNYSFLTLALCTVTFDLST